MALISEPFCRRCGCCHEPGAHKIAPRPSKRDVSTSGKPSPAIGLQAEVAHAGTGSGTPAVREGRSSEGGGKDQTAKASAKATAPTGKFDRALYQREYMRGYMRRYRARKRLSP